MRKSYDDSVDCTTKAAAPHSDTIFEIFDRRRRENHEHLVAAQAARVQHERAAQAAAKAEQVTIAAEKRADERAAKASSPAAPVTQSLTAPVTQPQAVNVTAIQTQEVSVADAARQARIAKVMREAKEKAERDNPPPQ